MHATKRNVSDVGDVTHVDLNKMTEVGRANLVWRMIKMIHEHTHT